LFIHFYPEKRVLTPFIAIGGYKSGNRYVISEGNHRMAAALKVAEETRNTSYVMSLLAKGR